ncbi:MAG: EamA family transporter [Spirochaetia bacterium]
MHKNSLIDKIPVWAFAVTACLMWSTAFTGVKIALLYTSPLRLAGLRFFLSGVLLLQFVGGIPGILRLIKKTSEICVIPCLLSNLCLMQLFYSGN